jgi:predicted GNAT superfamily acetyltransferase
VTTSDPVVRPLDERDHAAVLALNNAHTAEMGSIDAGWLRKLLAAASAATAIGRAGDPDAFLLAFDERPPAQGPNHAWFLARHPRFLYIDRVCVHARARRRGLARALYAELIRQAALRGTPIVCCEVTTDPPNPTSDAFHAALGFHEVGRAFLPDRGKSVHYLERTV